MQKVNVDMSSHLVFALDAEAAEHEETRSQAAARLIDDWLERHERA